MVRRSMADRSGGASAYSVATMSIASSASLTR